MFYRTGLALFLLLVLQGCAYVSYTNKLETPVALNVPEKQYLSSLEITHQNEQLASIGDELFRVGVYIVGADEHINFKATTGDDFPNNNLWEGTYVYNDGESGDLIVYTNPKYYEGSIGVILDSDGQIATSLPLVQVATMKKGRRWPLNGTGKFFVYTDRLIEKWGLRYSGIKDSNYVFEIVNKYDSNVTEIIQSIQVTESSYLEGVIIRGVLIKGLEKDKHGVIKYKLHDKLSGVARQGD
jgi:hypothetical protein